MEKEQKPKRVLSPEQLEKLKVAREKALKVRQANAEQRKKEKDLKKLEKQAKQKEIEEKLMNYQEAPAPEPTPEPEEEPEETTVAPPVKKPKKKTKKPIVIVEESDSSESEDEQVVYIKRAKGKRSVAEKPLERTQSGFADWGRQNTFGGGFYRR